MKGAREDGRAFTDWQLTAGMMSAAMLHNVNRSSVSSRTFKAASRPPEELRLQPLIVEPAKPQDQALQA
jgi:hypothetical protein